MSGHVYLANANRLTILEARMLLVCAERVLRGEIKDENGESGVSRRATLERGAAKLRVAIDRALSDTPRRKASWPHSGRSEI